MVSLVLGCIFQNHYNAGTVLTKQLLEDVAAGRLSAEEALVQFQIADVSDIGYAKVDHARALRQGVSEVIYGEGKTADQIRGICDAMREAGQDRILITRLSPEKAQALPEEFALDYHELAQIGILGGMPEPDGNGSIAADKQHHLACADAFFLRHGLVYYPV